MGGRRGVPTWGERETPRGGSTLPRNSLHEGALPASGEREEGSRAFMVEEKE